MRNGEVWTGRSIILSRKGFDSSTGGIPSPILPGGELFSFPIPDDQAPATYGQIDAFGRTASDLLTDLTGRPNVGPHSWAGIGAHLDPDLRAASVSRSPGWRPLFGQSRAAQRHLANNNIASGDLFLFFGWFRKTTLDNGTLRFLTGREGGRDLHVIFGWLEIGTIWPLGAGGVRTPLWAQNHPHVRTRHGGPPGWPHNTIYVASRGGVFRCFDPLLQLTAPSAPHRSLWQLPACFHPYDPPPPRPPLTYHGRPAFWRLNGQHVMLQSCGRGQTYVLDANCYGQRVRDWVNQIIALPTV
jgi:hypothetical protein